MVMLHSGEIWNAILTHIEQDRWVTIEELYSLVETHLHPDGEDTEPESSGSTSPRWKRNVRNVLQSRKHSGEILWNGKGSYMVSKYVEAELSRRRRLWEALIDRGGATNVSPTLIRHLGIHGGAQAVWFDKKVTKPVDPNKVGVTVGLLHLGMLHTNDLSDDGLIFHYPKTNRQPGRDRAEVEATKSAGRLGLPVFVTLTASNNTRSVKVGRIENWDDRSSVFLVALSDIFPEYAGTSIQEDSDGYPFVAFSETDRKMASISVRTGQQRFKFRTLSRYGTQCAVCGVSVHELLEAAHIIPKENYGSDDPRNGIILCANHHAAFDAGLFSIHPNSLELAFKPAGPSQDELYIKFDSISHLVNPPHPEALEWRWRVFRSRL